MIYTSVCYLAHAALVTRVFRVRAHATCSTVAILPISVTTIAYYRRFAVVGNDRQGIFQYYYEYTLTKYRLWHNHVMSYVVFQFQIGYFLMISCNQIFLIHWTCMSPAK